MQGRHRALVEVPRSVNPDETEVVVRVLSDYLGSQVLKIDCYLELPYILLFVDYIAVCGQLLGSVVT